MSKNISKLCSENLEKGDNTIFYKISDIYSERGNLIKKLELMSANKESEERLKLFVCKNSKEIQKIVDLDAKIINILEKKKIEMAHELRKIHSNMNVLIYK